jgi:hypothetical protein
MPNNTEEVDPHQELRAKIYSASLEESNAFPRWGYFGIPASLAIGDNSYAPRMVRKPPVEDEAETTRNIQAAPLKKGSDPSVYFDFAPPLGIGDPYVDPGKRDSGHKKIWYLVEDCKFKPPGSVKAYESTNKLGYLYEPHCDTAKDPKEVREKYRDYQPPRQIYSKPMQKGGGGCYTPGVLFGFDEEGHCLPEHLSDDFDAAKKMRLKDLEEHKSKLQETSWKSMDYGNKAFSSHTDTYMYDVPTHIPREPKPFECPMYPHEAAFKPSAPMKKGHEALMGGIPEYVSEGPPKVAVRKPKDDDAPPAFRLGNARSVCNPMPSVTTNMRNMRNERPSSFSRPML